MSDIEFVNGMIIKERRDGAPDFLIASLSIKRDELIAWLQGKDDEWINVDLKTAKSGKLYAAVNAWKPGGSKHSPSRQDRNDYALREPERKHDEFEDDLPF